jgi:hypothetical protein
MADVQSYFEKFHVEIRTDYEMNKTLRDKRDIILAKIKKHVDESSLPRFERILQGSYIMGTGIVPQPGEDYDIDIGLAFHVNVADYPEPNVVRGWMLDAVGEHTADVQNRGPCIRVNYRDRFHVDLVVYGRESVNAHEHLRLGHKSRGWIPADPHGLRSYVDEAREPFGTTKDSATQTDQLRRVIRYLKRWNDHAIPNPSSDKPTGIALTMLAIKALPSPCVRWFDNSSDDAAALDRIACHAETLFPRISATKPTPEHEDLFSGICDASISELRDRFTTLRATLRAVAANADPHEACKALAEVFGPDFPIPKQSETGRSSNAPAIITSSASA